MILKNHEIYHQYMYSYPHKTAYRKQEGVQLKDFQAILEQKPVDFYVHVPFCSSKCGYCNLFSCVGVKKEFVDQYLESLSEQEKNIADQMKIKMNSLTIGGGTPLYLTECQLRKLFEDLKKHFPMNYQNLNSCIETSPMETTEEKLKVLEEYRIKRISIGVQSFHEEELKALRRNHTASMALQALEIIRASIVPILNIDIIYGIYGQTKKSLGSTIKQALQYEPEEIFLYPLYIREGKHLKATDENMMELYRVARESLLDNGYMQASMRRFTKTKQETTSCGFENMLSIGVGGRSYLDNFHTCAPFTDKQSTIRKRIEEYVNQNQNFYDHGFYLNEDERKRRFIIKNLLVTKGLLLSDYQKCFTTDLFLDFPQCRELIVQGLCIQKEGRLTLTEKGLALSDYIGPLFISDTVKVLMSEWSDDLV